MKTKNLLRVIAAVSLLTVFSCAKEIEQEITPVENPGQTGEVTTYTMTIIAGKGEPSSKALSLEGTTLNATWAQGEKVTVHNDTKNADLDGYLEAQSNGESTTLKGILNGTIETDDILTLKFLSPRYGTQDGTLEYIAANCDYATATVTASVSGTNVTTTNTANFVNQQAIVKFTLKESNASGTAIAGVSSLVLTVGETTITVTPSHATNVLYVAIPSLSNGTLNMEATAGDGTKRYYSKSGLTLAGGTYHEIGVKMALLVKTEEELNAAIANNYKKIALGADISLTAYVKIGQNAAQTVTIDLNGYKLSRNLSAVDANGHVIEVFANGNLTLTDSSTGHTGQITGGWANNGGGICNKGTLTLNNVIITGCKATDGGGIKSFAGASLTITGGAISNCRSDAGGGGVVNYGTASISGCTFSGNTATTRGGAIWSNSGLTVDNCTFTGNEALAVGGSGQNEGDGGAMHINGGTATLTSVTITNNTSKDAGGIYVASGATLNLGGTSTLSGNESTVHGGGGIVNQGTVNLSDDVTITGNTCKTNGCGIWSNGTLNMRDNVTITGNTREDGVPQNVFLKSGKMITVTGPLTIGAKVAVFLEAGSGKFTSGYDTHNSGIAPSVFFTADLINQGVTLNEGDAMLSSLEGTVYYIEREWDEQAKKVKATQKTVTEFHVMNNDDRILADNTWYVVNSNVTIPQGYAAKVEGTAHLIICDGAKLTAAINLEIGNELHIYTQSLGSGMIDADGGIGPFRRGPMGDLFIHGGIINATGDTNHAGIGTYHSTTPIPNYGSIDGGNITIYDGTITATGGDYAAGIGGGDCRTYEYYEQHIKIYGGTVVAKGGSYSAGIGNGAGIEMLEHNNDYLIEIFGGNVEAHGGKYGAGIGSGQGKSAGTLKVYGGIVKAYGGEDGAGIGSGERTTSTTSTINGGKVFINGGKVYAYGGAYGAGIGGGQDSNGATVEVNDGYVFADGGTDAAGIGSGEKYMPGTPNGGKLTVNGGHVFADGTGWGAGIGGGEDCDGAEVIINGGIVEAYAGSDAGNSGGCAIGSEDGDGHRGSLTIDDKMMVHAGQTPSSFSIFTAVERVSACWFRPYARIEPCDHSGQTSGATCPYCGQIVP